MATVEGYDPSSSGLESDILPIELHRYMDSSAGLEPATTGLEDLFSSNWVTRRNGRGRRTRTFGLWVIGSLLYQLSYTTILEGLIRFELIPFGLQPNVFAILTIDPLVDSFGYDPKSERLWAVRFLHLSYKSNFNGVATGNWTQMRRFTVFFLTIRL
jgi:hypothetical protein